jgi:zinc transport system substrate-binding protein
VKRFVLVFVLISAIGPVVAIAPAAARSKVDVVAAFYPVAYAVERVGGGRVDVTNLTPAGAEPHDLELSPKQIDEILDARLVVVLGHGFQPAVERAADQRDGTTVTLFDELPQGAGKRTTRAGGAGSLDPHVWLDPVSMRAIVDRVRAALAKADPSGRAVYGRNAAAFEAELAALDRRYRSGLGNCTRDLIVTSHEAFGHLADRYGLREEGVAGLGPDAEPDAKRIAQLADLAKREDVTVVFTETLLSPRLARTLAQEVGVGTETLDPLEGLTDAQVARSATYTSVMDANLAKLERALGCS